MQNFCDTKPGGTVVSNSLAKIERVCIQWVAYQAYKKIVVSDCPTEKEDLLLALSLLFVAKIPAVVGIQQQLAGYVVNLASLLTSSCRDQTQN